MNVMGIMQQIMSNNRVMGNPTRISTTVVLKLQRLMSEDEYQ
jgi:hypothetical protein